MDAETYVKQHQTCMYPLVPTMRGVHADLITQVIKELSEVYRDDKKTLSDQIFWMKLFLERNYIVSPLEKQKIEERLNMFEQLFEESPMVQKMRKQSYEQGEVETLQRILVKDVQRRFAELTELAQKKVQLVNKPDVLESLYQQVQEASDIGAVQQLLVSISEQQV